MWKKCSSEKVNLKRMTKLINKPSIIRAAGTKEKIIKEFFGMVNSASSEISIAKMESPEGWEEPGQTPDFDEYTVVLKGKLQVKTKENTFEIGQEQGIFIPKNHWVQYSSPFEGGAEYIAICLPAFSPQTVHRDSE
jgi:mannose-6-phosphate isomerase-like protein (cupin superfamily)